VSGGNIQGTDVTPRISEWTAIVSLNINKCSVLVTEYQCHIILIPLLNYAVSCHDYIVSVLGESDMIVEHWWMTVTGQNRSMWRKAFYLPPRLPQTWTCTGPGPNLGPSQCKKGDKLIFSWYINRIFKYYTGCFTTLGHNCRRWFPRSLWWKKFI